jgi:hypothetical protein
MPIIKWFAIPWNRRSILTDFIYLCLWHWLSMWYSSEKGRIRKFMYCLHWLHNFPKKIPTIKWFAIPWNRWSILICMISYTPSIPVLRAQFANHAIPKYLHLLGILLPLSGCISPVRNFISTKAYVDWVYDGCVLRFFHQSDRWVVNHPINYGEQMKSLHANLIIFTRHMQRWPARTGSHPACRLIIGRMLLLINCKAGLRR